MTPADTHLNKMTWSAMTVAEEPDVRRDLRVLNICLERRADLDMGHASWETPEVLRREVVPVVRSHRAIGRCKPLISDPHYIMSSRHARVDGCG